MMVQSIAVARPSCRWPPALDVDWRRYRIAGLYASGDPNSFDASANGFDAIIDQPFFAGGPFSYWNVQGIGLLGTRLTNKLSPLPDLTPSKFEGQANFVNPGILIANAAFDAEITPKIKIDSECKLSTFRNLINSTIPKSTQFVMTSALTIATLYRPFLNNAISLSATGLYPLGGFQDIYAKMYNTIFQHFILRKMDA
jgi:hypothetical protein